MKNFKKTLVTSAAIALLFASANAVSVKNKLRQSVVTGSAGDVTGEAVITTDTTGVVGEVSNVIAGIASNVADVTNDVANNVSIFDDSDWDAYWGPVD